MRLLLLLSYISAASGALPSNSWGTLDGGGDFFTASHGWGDDMADNYGSTMENLERAERKTDWRSKNNMPTGYGGISGYMPTAENVGGYIGSQGDHGLVMEQGNLAEGKVANQSSVLAGTPAAAVVVDGNHDASFLSGTCMHTQREDDPWWRVDMAEIYQVSTVRIWNRGEGENHPHHGSAANWGRFTPHPHEGWHLSNAEVYVGATADSRDYQCGHHQAQARFWLHAEAGTDKWRKNLPKQAMFGDGGTLTVPCGYPAEVGIPAGSQVDTMPEGQFVTIVNRGTSLVLSLCEVQVFGWPNPCSPRQKTSQLARFCPTE